MYAQTAWAGLALAWAEVQLRGGDAARADRVIEGGVMARTAWLELAWAGLAKVAWDRT